MRALIFAMGAVLALAACADPDRPPPGPNTLPLGHTTHAAPADIQAALTDPRRPAEDVARDAARKPLMTLVFSGLKQGDIVGELLPGGGYFTRILAVAVGPEGRVYPTIRPSGVAGEYETPIIPLAAQYSNAPVAQLDFAVLDYPEPLDLIFTAQNYHDMHIAQYNLGDPNAVNRAAFRALRPGGVYIIIDHAAIAGADIATATAIHRIDEAQVRREVEAAGFVFDSASPELRNRADPRTQNVFDPAIRGHTDQFMLRFIKPS